MLKKFIIKLIKLYRKRVSPNTPPKCRFYPTCSEYALEAFERFGVIKAFLLTLWRFLRCNPLFPGGYDPVPEKSKCKK